MTEPGLFSVAAADRALRAIEEIRRGISPRLQPLGIIVNRARVQNIQYLELMANPGAAAMERVRAATLSTDTPDTLLRRLEPQIDEYIRAAKADLDQAWHYTEHTSHKNPGRILERSPYRIWIPPPGSNCRRHARRRQPAPL